MANSFETKIRAWLTPGLITAFSIVSWSLIEEIRSDVKLLLNNDAQTRIRLEALEKRMERTESLLFGDKLFAIKPDEIELPKKRK
jgi:hypothetical protein